MSTLIILFKHFADDSGQSRKRQNFLIIVIICHCVPPRHEKQPVLQMLPMLVLKPVENGNCLTQSKSEV